jgi:hypothetical protein
MGVGVGAGAVMMTKPGVLVEVVGVGDLVITIITIWNVLAIGTLIKGVALSDKWH